MNNRINQYAESMFHFETPHPTWIDRCAQYLKHIFGDSIKGSTVIDYAFGRGNWSLAFLQAGAKKVISIDAAHSNVVRFGDYLKEKKISGIEIVEGNILEQPIEASGDILWIYGILPCIAEPQKFLKLIAAMLKGSFAQGLLYAYNSSSLRQVIVDLARKSCSYDTYEEFTRDAFLYTHHARLRVRDDLTAPCVYWYSKKEMWNLLLKAGCIPTNYVDSFQDFEGTSNQEFSPHHLQFNLRTQNSGEVSYQGLEIPSLNIDDKIINEFGKQLFQINDEYVTKKMAIGLVNTHFSALANGGYQAALLEDFLFLFYAYSTLGLKPISDLQQKILFYAQNSMKGILARTIEPEFEGSQLIRFLTENSIRI